MAATARTRLLWRPELSPVRPKGRSPTPYVAAPSPAPRPSMGRVIGGGLGRPPFGRSRVVARPLACRSRDKTGADEYVLITP